MLKRVENKRVTFVSYLKLLVYFLITLSIILLIRSFYLRKYEKEINIPIIKNTIAEIKPTDIYNYLQENDNIIIYMCVANNRDCRNFESRLKRYLDNNTYNNEITYLNLSDIDTNSFFKEFNSKYSDKAINHYPIFVVFRDGRIVDYLKIKSTTNFVEVRNFIEDYGQNND